MGEEKIVKRRYQWKPQGRRPRGRPRKRWKDAIEETLRNNNLPSIAEIKQTYNFERKEWKAVLTRLTG